MNNISFICSDCNKNISYIAKGSVACGYATNDNDGKICYDCCGKQDAKYMHEHGKITLYLSEDNNKYYVSNWPGTLKFPVLMYKKGNHNMASCRYDIWFFDDVGNKWHGVQYGDNTQICHCKQMKAKAA